MSTARPLPLLPRMARDLDAHGSLRTSSAAARWSAYAAHTSTSGTYRSGRRHLTGLYGQPYTDYLRRTRRWCRRPG